MSKAVYLSDLRRRLQKLEARMKADGKRIAGGSPHEKVQAAGDLALAEGRLAETKEKLSRLEAEPDSLWEVGRKARIGLRDSVRYPLRVGETLGLDRGVSHDLRAS